MIHPMRTDVLRIVAVLDFMITLGFHGYPFF
jgi:hypothetical protein